MNAVANTVPLLVEILWVTALSAFLLLVGAVTQASSPDRGGLWLICSVLFSLGLLGCRSYWRRARKSLRRLTVLVAILAALPYFELTTRLVDAELNHTIPSGFSLYGLGPFGLRVAILCGVFAVVAWRSQRKTGSNFKTREYLFLLACSVAGSAYATANDLVTLRISDAYFSVGKGMGDDALMQNVLSLALTGC
jgi:hypothetical protein